MLDKEVENN